MKNRLIGNISFIAALFLFAAPALHAQQQYVYNSETDSVIAYYTDKIDPDQIASYMQDLENMGTRFCLAENRKEVAEWIQNKFIAFGYPDTYLDSFLMINTYQGVAYETWQYNVISSMTGHTRPDEVYILGAHYDDIISQPGNPFIIAPGADDNASGVAVALEVARVMKEYNYQPEATIKFIAFAAEEVGLKGSWNYAAKAFDNNMDIKMMINNDMISNNTAPEEDWRFKLYKYNEAEWLTELANYIALNFTTLNIEEFVHTSANTDSWPFHHYGYNAVFLHEHEFSPYYHSVNDLVVNTNKYYAAELTKVSLGMLVHENGTGVNVNGIAPVLSVSSRLYQNFPNPFSGHTTIKYSLSKPEKVTLQIFDAANRLIAVLQDVWQETGTHQVIFNTSDLASGIYFCRLQTDNNSATIKMAVYRQDLTKN